MTVLDGRCWLMLFGSLLLSWSTSLSVGCCVVLCYCLVVVLFGIAFGAGLFFLCWHTSCWRSSCWHASCCLSSCCCSCCGCCSFLLCLLSWFSAILGFGWCYIVLLGRWIHAAAWTEWRLTMLWGGMGMWVGWLWAWSCGARSRA